MAYPKLEIYPRAKALDGTEDVLISQGKINKKVSTQAIADLATVNGQALACQDMPIAQRAKSLMLSHAPKTDKYGSAFTDGTNNSYLAQTRSAQPCPATSVLSSQLDALAIRLQSSLPSTPASSQ